MLVIGGATQPRADCANDRRVIRVCQKGGLVCLVGVGALIVVLVWWCVVPVSVVDGLGDLHVHVVVERLLIAF